MAPGSHDAVGSSKVIVVPASERVRIARAALAAARAVPGVDGPDPDRAGVYGVRDGDSVLEGVSVAAASGGGFDVTLRLRCDLVPLHGLADEVRRAVAAAVADAGLRASLGTVSVIVADVVDPVYVTR